MKRMVLLAGLAFALLTATAQDSPYIVKTKGVKKTVKKAKEDAAALEEENEATDFMGRNFRFYSMCDWKEGMRFMVIPEKYDLLVTTFRDATNDKGVNNGKLRHKIMIYKGHEDMPNGRVHINFLCEDENRDYYYELPNGTFDEYCYGKMGVPTLAYLGDVDKARELLVGKTLLTRTQNFRIDTEYDGDGYRDVTIDKNKVVEVRAIGVGTRSFPVKIVVEDENGEQFYQNVAMSKTNCGMRDDELALDDNERFLFKNSFEFTDDNMAVSADVRDYLNATVHTKVATSMSSKGSGKVRDIRVPRFTGFVIDEIKPMKNNYFTLTLRETESRRIYYKDVYFNQFNEGEDSAAVKEDFFGYLFAMGEGEARSTSKETRAAIREGRVIRGMTKDEVEMAVGEASRKIESDDHLHVWLYARSNGVVLDVIFNEQGTVMEAKARLGDVNEDLPADQKKKTIKKGTKKNTTPVDTTPKDTPKKSVQKKNVGGIWGGTMETGSPIEE